MRIFEFETQKVVEVDESEGRKLVDSKRAVELEISELDRLEQKAEEVFEAYRTAVEGVKNSDNPLLQDEKVRAYELNKLSGTWLHGFWERCVYPRLSVTQAQVTC